MAIVVTMPANSGKTNNSRTIKETLMFSHLENFQREAKVQTTRSNPATETRPRDWGGSIGMSQIPFPGVSVDPHIFPQRRLYSISSLLPYLTW